MACVRYNPLHGAHEIRLLSVAAGAEPTPISCHLSHASLDEEPRYTALSYVWGDPANQESVLVDGNTVDVTVNLAAALRALRDRTADITLWVDALCINQQNLPEKSHQVQLMGKIYKTACTVASWMGKEDDEMIRARSFIADARANNFSQNWLLEATLHTPTAWYRRSLASVCAMFREEYRGYWARTWITQEIAFAQHGYLLFEGFQIPYSDVVAFANMLGDNVFVRQWLIPNQLPSGCELMFLANLANVIRQNEISRRDLPGSSLLSLLEIHRWKQASDARDKVFALLGLSSEEYQNHPLLVPNYEKSVEGVYTDAVKAIIEITGSLDILVSCIDRTTGAKERTLPTFVPDFRHWDLSSELSTQASKKRQGASASPACISYEDLVQDGRQRELLHAVGFRIGQVFVQGPPMPKVNSMEDNARPAMKHAIETFHIWQDMTRLFFGNSLAIEKELQRTLQLGRIDDEGSEFFVHIINTGRGCSREELANLFNDKEFLRWHETWATRTQENCGGCTCFLIRPTLPGTKEGDPGSGVPRIGIASGDVRACDLLCILLGCPVPLVIRHFGQYFKIVGVAYIDSLNDDQAMKDLEDDKYELESFAFV